MKQFRTTAALVCLVIYLPTNRGGAVEDQEIQSKRISDSISCALLLKPKPRFAVRGLEQVPADKLDQVFQVVVHRDDEDEIPAIMGTYQFADGTLSFQPRFPLDDSLTYAVRLGPALSTSSSNEPLLFQLPQTKKKKARVSAIYPSTSKLPENLLKFYIHFSAPMNRGEAYSRIQLLRAGTPVDGPFLELGEELWDPRQTRFTLFIHPGRIKRGLKPREDEGPSIAPGAEYTLKVSGDWTAANGLALEGEFEKRFSVLPADHAQPTPEEWQIKTPAKNSQDPVGLTFNEPLDHAMLGRVLIVKDRNEETVEGEIIISEDETSWKFVPSKPWPVGTYHIEVAANLEDLCGNSIARPFEVKMQQRSAARPKTKVAIEFIVK